jgi:ABC-type multidrug transport system fused ATPase/permease subunit
VRAAIGVVSSDGTVFRGTLADNIRYKRPQASMEEIRSAALSAGLGRALERLPDGLETEVGEHGVGLSLGERQRLQIARMLLDRYLRTPLTPEDPPREHARAPKHQRA